MTTARTVPDMRERLSTIAASVPVKEAADLMSTPHIDLLVVCGEDGGMVGVLTKTDIVGQIRHCLGHGCVARVETIMTRNVISCCLDTPLQQLWGTMKEKAVQRVPVLDDLGKPVGIVYARDALKCLLGEVEDEEGLLRDYVMGLGYR